MIELNKNNEIEVYNVVPIIRGNRVVKFITNISISEINKVYDRLIYDEDTQRGFKVVKKKGKEELEKIVNRENIEEMKDKILNSFFDGGTLIWNVRVNPMNDKNKVYDYDSEESKVVIKSQNITLPDSAQRHIVLNELANSKGLNVDSYYFPLSISFYTLEEEQSLFAEINGNGQRANKTRSLYLSNTQRSKFVKELIEKSSLNENVENKLSGVSKKEKLTTFATIYDSLFDKTNGAFKNIKDEDLDGELLSWLIKFYNGLINIRQELKMVDEETRNKYNKTSLAGANIMFYAYAILAKELNGYKQWKRKLSRLNNNYKYGQFEGDFLSLNNPLWHKLVCYENKNGEWRPVDSNRTRNVIKNEMLSYFNLGKYAKID